MRILIWTGLVVGAAIGEQLFTDLGDHFKSGWIRSIGFVLVLSVGKYMGHRGIGIFPFPSKEHKNAQKI